MTQAFTTSHPSPTVLAFLGRPKRMLIGGKWLPAESGETIAVCDPATENVIAEVPSGDRRDVDLAVVAARSAFDSGPWSRMSPMERSKRVWRLGDLIEAHADEIAAIEVVDNGKPFSDARNGDVAFSHDLFRYMAGWATKIHGHTIPLSSGDFHAYTLRSPVGVCGQIIPWNFPFMMAAWKMAPALAAGCTIVLKPAEQTPLSAIRLGELVEEAGFPPGVVNIVTGYGETAGAALAAHPDVDKIAFTGSTEVGRKIMAAAQGNLKKVTLELGGKSPMIVFPDADFERTVEALSSGVFYNMGQTCTAGTRLYAHAKVFDRIVDGVADAAAKLKVGSGFDPGTRIGPLISREQFERVFGYIESGKSEGARVHAGGKRVGEKGYFIEPTILTGARQDMAIVREEIFGPVLSAMSFSDDDVDAVVRQANDSVYGLAASVFTRDVSVAHRVARGLKAGTIGVNTHHVIDVALPFGGFKQSGFGREMGWDAIAEYTDVKSIGVAL